MEWYYVVAIIAAFALCVGGFVYLRKKGYVSSEQMNGLTNIITGLATLVGELTKKNQNGATDILYNVVTLVQQAVLAAENDWYNNKISKEERRERCMDELYKLLAAYDIVLTDSQWNVVDILVRAACEAIGHTTEIENLAEVTAE